MQPTCAAGLLDERVSAAAHAGPEQLDAAAHDVVQPGAGVDRRLDVPAEGLAIHICMVW